MSDRAAFVPGEPDPMELDTCETHGSEYPAGGKCRRCEWERGMEEFYSDRGPIGKGD